MPLESIIVTAAVTTLFLAFGASLFLAARFASSGRAMPLDGGATQPDRAEPRPANENGEPVSARDAA